MCVYLAFFNKTMLVTFHHCNKIFKKNNLKKKRLGLMFSGHAQLTPLFFMSVTRQRCHGREAWAIKLIILWRSETTVRVGKVYR